ncbi:DUF2971 domain-containing protein [Geobacter sp. SVR]|uniref:DUF2971 domain-containing protein n=1 Tax=Geobacter sp. SVR TaxID=2495594 RepID=UPI00143EF822|nr:DUF2971 domain-containing protein [Geobacter sp. SVR]BCS53899.1 hypothetical protein GSVR_22070 [Geobacter sp. SVR]GCF86323.1 hypothetical protein GSbR_29230 [Geobacter sp. SVR]
MRVYYLTGAQYALSNIALRRIKISRFADLNDPFELLGVDLTNKAHRPAFRATKREINENRGLICFSKSWKNPLLWGHYAEKHTGMALGFDIPDELLASVIYATDLIKFKINQKTKKPMINEKIIDELLRTKFSDWAYENEMRLFVRLDHDKVESGMYFYPFSQKFVLREVILGPRCELPIDGVRNHVSNFSAEVEVIKSRIAFSRFEVLKNKVASRVRVKSK